MNSATVVVVVVSIITAKGCAVLGLWLRWRVRHEQVKGRNLSLVAEAIAAGGQLEWDEQRGEQHRLRIRITRTPAGRRDTTA